MNKKLQQLLEQIIPFIILGIAIAFAIGLFVMFSYVLVWGILIGGVFWLISLVKNFFAPKKKHPSSKKGRIIEHDDNHHS